MKSIHVEAKPAVKEKHYTDGTLHFRTCRVFGWSVLTTEGWCPLESMNYESISYLRDRLKLYEASGLFPQSLHRLATKLVCDRKTNPNGYFMPFFFVTPHTDTKTQVSPCGTTAQARLIRNLKISQKKQTPANGLSTADLPRWPLIKSERTRRTE